MCCGCRIPSGGWGYQGNDPGTFTRVAQMPLRPSLWAAGLGSLYVLADFLGLSRPVAPRKTPKGRSRRVASGGVGSERGRESRSRAAPGDGCVEASDERRQRVVPPVAVAADERVAVLLLVRRTSATTVFASWWRGPYEAEPKWYNDGVRLLQSLQTDYGTLGHQRGQRRWRPRTPTRW